MVKSGKLITAVFGGMTCRITVGAGVLADLAQLDLPRPDRTAALVSSRVYRLHRERIHRALASIGDPAIIEFEDGEENKSYGNAGNFLERLLKERLTRSSIIVAIGGGVTGDFAGFLASVYMRGIPFIQVPTTLLAMVDASVGGKVAVNLSAGKNMVGSFHQPSAVIADTDFLETLPEREYINGMAEVVKHSLIGDEETLNLLEHGPGAEDLASLVLASVAFKASVVEKDEKEGGHRKILNFGHTVGHAIESSLGYRGVLHGEAVAVGMWVKLGICRDLGAISEDEYRRAIALIRRYRLLNRELRFDPREVIRHMAYDKKNEFNRVRFVLLEGLGKPVIDAPLEEARLQKYLEGFLDEMKRGEGSC